MTHILWVSTGSTDKEKQFLEKTNKTLTFIALKESNKACLTGNSALGVNWKVSGVSLLNCSRPHLEDKNCITVNTAEYISVIN